MKSAMKSRGMRLLVLLGFIMLAWTAVEAENGGEREEKKEILTALEQRMQKRIDKLEFREEEIDNVITMIARYADIDIIKSPDVTGTITATLTDVPVGEALNNILAAHNFGYIKSEHMLRIVPLKEITERPERLVSRIYWITYADVEEVEKTLQKIISDRGSLSSSRSTSNIIVTDTESRIKAIDTFIAEIDRITPQVLVEVRIYDITSQDTLDLGIEWSAGRNTTIESAVGSNPTAGRKDPFIRGLFNNATSKTGSSDKGLLRLGWFNAGIDIDTMLKAQQEITSAELLANPRILVLDNETANFEIIREIPYTESTALGGAGVTETILFKEVGVTLEVTPHITRDGMLRLHIIPEFGVVASTSEGGIPTVDTRKLDTITLVQDGQTVVLGGLRKKEVSKQVNKIPLLGDLPLVGGLFRFEGEDTTITELVVFITPRIITTPVLSETERRAYEVTEFDGPEPAFTRAEKAAEKAKKKAKEKEKARK